MRAHARSGVTLILLILVAVALPWSVAVAQTPLTGQAQAIIAKVTSPWGSGGGLSVIRDGDRPPAGSGDTRRQYDSYDGANAATEDWIGYTFATPQTFTRVVFQEGLHFWDGGWFLNLTVQVRQGTTWVAVQNLVTTPAYPGNNGVGFETFTLNFTAIQGDGIRIRGAPGGNAAFISVAELEVFGSATTGSGGGTPTGTATSVTAEAQAIIAKVTSPWGSGGGLSVIRDGDRPPAGSGDTRRQYDSYDGANAATEDWIGYTFATSKTFTRVVFQEGLHFWDGGWFRNLTVQVRQGTAWVGVQGLLTTPAYPGNNGVGFETFTLNFTAIQGDAIRIHGAPAGSAGFISVAELDVFATSGTGGGGTGPDLTVQSLTVSPGSVSSGGSVNVNFTVRNPGTAAVGASSAGVYLMSTPTAALPGIASLKTVSVPALAAGASTVVATNATLPSSGAGTYYIVAAADPGGAIAESSETNNRASAGLSVTGATGGINVWVVDSLTRVQPTDPAGTIRSASVKAARNEYETFQLIVKAPAGAALSNVNAVASDLVGPAVISQSNVTLYRAHYVPVIQSSPASPYPPGLHADALIPFKHPETGQPLGGRFPAAPFPVSAGQNQPVWVEIFVPPNTPPGTYSGAVTVTASGVASTTVPITLTVWNFTLPTTPSLRTAFGEFWSLWAKFGLTPGTAAGNDLEWRFAKAALAHRVTPSRAGLTTGWYSSDGTALPNNSAMTEWFGTLGATSWKIPEFFTSPLGADRPKMIRYLRTIYDYLASRGWADRAFIYPAVNDEPGSSGEYQEIRNYSAMVREANPNIKVLLVNSQNLNPEWGSLDGSVDIWVQHFYIFSPTVAQTLKATGDRVWSYTAGATGSFPSWCIDHPIIAFRVPQWAIWKNRIDGLLSWQMTWWNGVSDPWTDTRTVRFSSYVLNGDGSLFYPGNAVGYTGPIVSARLKTLRDGMEDYEYLKILAGIIGAAGADSQAAAVASSFSSWNRSPANLLAVREAVGQRINSP